LKKVQVFFRVDGDSQIGLGHLVRCIALAQMLKDEFKITFVCKTIPETIVNEIKQLGFNLSIIKSEGEFISSLLPATIVVIDHYSLDSDYQKNIKNVGCKLVCIDDLHDKVFFADLIINHAPGITPAHYNAQTYTQYALGLDYALLRSPFLRIKQNEKPDIIKTVFVCFGGADSKNITQVVIDILKQDPRVEKVNVVLGSAYQYLSNLKEAVSNNNKFKLHYAIGPDEMADLIADAQLAIVPSSGILQEVLAVGNKVISGMYVENQKWFFENYKALGVFESADDFAEESIKKAIDKCYENTDKQTSRLIDGKSGDRLLKYFNQLKLEDEVTLNNVKESDLLKTFEWASDQEIRKFSFNSNTVKFDEHQAWFTNKLKDNNCFYYLASVNNKEFGSIRFDVKDNKAIISYLIDPLYQNQGLGTILLKKGLERFLSEFKGEISCIYGDVLFENIASIKIFQKLGYTTEINSSANIVRFKKTV
jgi:UDP-2,4-diacetamido-2,4,6-trideoxy-beta-L-altropyranose hydrolase